MSALYETDFAAWSVAQARAIRKAGARQVNEPIDWENVAEEIEDLGKSVRRELRTGIGTIIEHLLKLEASPATEPQASWRTTVLRNRREITPTSAARFRSSCKRSLWATGNSCGR